MGIKTNEGQRLVYFANLSGAAISGTAESAWHDASSAIPIAAGKYIFELEISLQMTMNSSASGFISEFRAGLGLVGDISPSILTGTLGTVVDSNISTPRRMAGFFRTAPITVPAGTVEFNAFWTRATASPYSVTSWTMQYARFRAYSAV